MSTVEVTPASPSEHGALAGLAAAAMIDLPENVPVFRGREDRLAGTFRVLFDRGGGEVWTARREGEAVGVLRVVPWPACNPGPLALARLAPAMLAALGPAALRAARLKLAWGPGDPRRPHLHLEPLAVREGLAGQGLGSGLMRHLCERLDREGLEGHLETGTRPNVRFYERFGFAVVDEVTVFGVPTWLMTRPARAANGDAPPATGAGEETP